MTDISVKIRRAEVRDLPILATFALALAQVHASFDEERFVLPDEGTFRRFFEGELPREDGVILIAEIGAEPIAYAFLRLEPGSIEGLCDAAVWLHDIYVVPGARACGVGHLLVEAAFDAARRLGATGLMLSVSPHNESGRALFARIGFRPTMIEMRADLKVQNKPIEF